MENTQQRCIEYFLLKGLASRGLHGNKPQSKNLDKMDSVDEHGDPRNCVPFLPGSVYLPPPNSPQLLPWNRGYREAQARCLSTVQQSQVSHALLFSRSHLIDGNTHEVEQSWLSLGKEKRPNSFPGS